MSQDAQELQRKNKSLEHQLRVTNMSNGDVEYHATAIDNISCTHLSLSFMCALCFVLCRYSEPGCAVDARAVFMHRPRDRHRRHGPH